MLKQSTTRNLAVFMTDTADHIAGKASLTLTITASKDGGAFASITPTVTDLGSGWYNLALTTTHTNTLGDFLLHITGTGADPTDIREQVVVDLPGASVSSVSGAVGSVTGAVGSVTGAVGSVTGAVGSVASGGITEASFATTAGSFSPLGVIDQGTAQSATGTTLVLRSAAAFANSELVGAHILITGGTTGVGQVRKVTGYVGATDTATVDAWTTTPTGTITYKVLAAPPIATTLPTVNTTQLAGQTITAAAGVTFPSSVASPTNITAGTITTVTNLTNLPAIPANWLTAAGIAASALNGKGDWMVSYTQPTGFLAATFPATVASPTNITAGTITTVTNLTNAPTAGDLTATMKTSVTTAATAATPVAASVTGAVGSVTGNVGGNVTGSVGSVVGSVASVTGNVGGSVASVVGAVGSVTGLTASNLDATISSRLASASYTVPPTVAQNADAVWDEAISGHMGAGSTGEALSNAGGAGTPPTVGAIADAVWDELLSGHAVSGSTGAALSASGGAADPWLTALPGAYGSGTAGKIIGDNINATIGSRASQTSVDDVPTNAELATALGTADDAVLAQVALVKAKTDLITATPAAVGDVPTAAQVADKILGRNLAGGSDGTRTVKDALRSLRNKTSITAGTLTVTEEDDTTTAWTAVVTTAAGDPLTSIDPA